MFFAGYLATWRRTARRLDVRCQSSAASPARDRRPTGGAGGTAEATGRERTRDSTNAAAKNVTTLPIARVSAEVFVAGEGLFGFDVGAEPGFGGAGDDRRLRDEVVREVPVAAQQVGASSPSIEAFGDERVELVVGSGQADLQQPGCQPYDLATPVQGCTSGPPSRSRQGPARLVGGAAVQHVRAAWHQIADLFGTGRGPKPAGTPVVELFWLTVCPCRGRRRLVRGAAAAGA
jgi:hypothetical protein